MSGMADSIRERRAREVPEKEEGVVEEAIEEFEEEWPEEEEEWEDEWEDEEEWEEPLSPRTLIERVLGPLLDFVVDVTTLAAVPAALLLIATQTTAYFDIVETALLLWSGTAITLMISNAKTRLLQKLRLR